MGGSTWAVSSPPTVGQAVGRPRRVGLPATGGDAGRAAAAAAFSAAIASRTAADAASYSASVVRPLTARAHGNRAGAAAARGAFGGGDPSTPSMWR